MTSFGEQNVISNHHKSNTCKNLRFVAGTSFTDGLDACLMADMVITMTGFCTFKSYIDRFNWTAVVKLPHWSLWTKYNFIINNHAMSCIVLHNFVDILFLDIYYGISITLPHIYNDTLYIFQPFIRYIAEYRVPHTLKCHDVCFITDCWLVQITWNVTWFQQNRYIFSWLSWGSFCCLCLHRASVNSLSSIPALLSL